MRVLGTPLMMVMLMAEIDDAIEQNRRDLIKREKQISAEISKSWRDVAKTLEREIRALDLDDDWNRWRYESLLKQVNAEMTKYATGPLSKTIDRSKRLAGISAENEALNLMRLQLNDDAITGSFNRLPVQPFETMFGTTTRGPLANLLGTFGTEIEVGLRQQLLEGIALGLNPREVARNMVRELGLSKDRADNITRTEMIRAHRESSRETYRQNRHVVKSYVRSSALDDRTCVLCWALHGQVYSLDETFESHPRCRCALIPQTKTWDEILGTKTNIPETSYTTPTGSEIFKTLTPDKQKTILGSGAFDAFQRGDVDITDFVGRKESPQWGTTIVRLPNSVVIP